MRKQFLLKIWQRTAGRGARAQGSALVSAQVVQSLIQNEQTLKHVSTSIVCRGKLFLSSTSHHLAASCSSMFYSDHRFSDYVRIIFLFRWYLCWVKSFQVADLFRFYDSILADTMTCFFHVTNCIQFDFSCVQLQYPFWVSKLHIPLLVPKGWCVTPNCYQ